MPPATRSRREPKGALVCFDGTMLDVGDTHLITDGSSIKVASNDGEVSGILYFMSPEEAARALEKIKAGELEYVASKPYLDDLPIIGGMTAEWEKLRRLGFIGIDWSFCGHVRSWGLRKLPGKNTRNSLRSGLIGPNHGARQLVGTSSQRLQSSQLLKFFQYFWISVGEKPFNPHIIE
jgi:hypothetical protein